MDPGLRTSLWNILHIFYLNNLSDGPLRNSDANNLFHKLWVRYFQRPLDEVPRNGKLMKDFLKKWFFGCEWFEVYDFIEAIVQSENESRAQRFKDACNKVLEIDLSVYRFVDDVLAPITNDLEADEVESALTSANDLGLHGAENHIRSAVEKLAVRKNPDYRNCIKESMSAVESIARLMSGDPKATLGAALKVLKGRMGLHSALEQAFTKLFGYTSDEEGIRHGMLGAPNLEFEDAKFMLVCCSAFVNYLLVKAQKSGIKLTT
jgi:hypothetical protein